MLTSLEYAADELTAAANATQNLLTDFGLEVENAELDGISPPTEFTDKERRQLREAVSATRAALHELQKLEASNE